MTRIGRQDTSDAAGLLHNWAMNIALTNTLEALARHRRVVDIFEGEEPDSVPTPVRLNYGVGLNRLARYPEARTEHQAVEALARKHGDPMMLGMSALGVARACRGLGDLVGARAALGEAATALRAIPGQLRLGADLAREEGLLAAAEGRPEEARRRLGDALLIHEKVAEKHVSHVETLLELAHLELRAGDTGEAERHTRAALALAEKFRGQTPHSAWVGLSLLALGEVYEARHDAVGARALFREAVDHMTPTLGSDHPAVREARTRLSPPR
jgi:tetratricopeptide (TPR) repeat protein